MLHSMAQRRYRLAKNIEYSAANTTTQLIKQPQHPIPTLPPEDCWSMANFSNGEVDDKLIKKQADGC